MQEIGMGLAAAGTQYCFLDANVLIHFQSFDSVDWPKVLGADQVELIIAPSVMRDLDKFKDDSTQQGRRDRVRKVLGKLETYLPPATSAEAGRVVRSVFIRDLTVEPSIDWAARQLDSTIPDDRLLASVLEFSAAHPDRPVVLLTNDFPLRRKAQRVGVEALSPERLLTRTDEKSDAEKEVAKLRREVATYRDRAPKVKFGVVSHEEGANPVVVPRGVFRPNRPSNADLDTWVASLKDELEDEVRYARGTVDRDNVNEFEEEFRHYMVNFRAVEERKRAKRFDWRYEFSFALSNEGSAAAEDVDLVLRFPDGTFVVSKDEENDEVDGFGDLEQFYKPTPKWRQRPKASVYPYLPPVISTPFVLSRPTPWSIWYQEHPERGKVPSGPHYRDDRNRVSFHHPKLWPKLDWRMPVLVAYLPPRSDRGFSVAYEINEDHLTEPQVGALHVVFAAPKS
jgi:rRNA-processing protein FCF1